MLTHQDVSYVDMHISMFDDIKWRHDDTPTIGILPYADKGETLPRFVKAQDDVSFP